MGEDKIEEVTRLYLREIGEFGIGDLVRVYIRSMDSKRQHFEVFEGIVIARHNSGINATFTVRKISHGIGVERIFPLHSDVIEKVEVVKRHKVRRAKLYFLRKGGKKLKSLR